MRGDIFAAARRRPADVPGAALVAHALARYVERHGGDTVRVHLVGHSAGSIFHSALLQRLIALGVEVETLTFLAPARRALRAHLRSG